MKEQVLKIVDKLWERPVLLYEVMEELLRRRPLALSEWCPQHTAQTGRLTWRRWRETADGTKESFVKLEGPNWEGEIQDPETHEVLFNGTGDSLEVAGRCLDRELFDLGYRMPPDSPPMPDVSPWVVGSGSSAEPSPTIVREVYDGRLAVAYWDGDGYTGRVGKEGGDFFASAMVTLAQALDDELVKRGFVIDKWTTLPDGRVKP